MWVFIVIDGNFTYIIGQTTVLQNLSRTWTHLSVFELIYLIGQTTVWFIPMFYHRK